MKGIILAGGSGTRLRPMTSIQSKHLIPVYDKPMIYYPLSSLMLGGIREILIISTPRDLPDFRRLLSDGSDIGIDLKYMEQPTPRGLPEAFILGKEFISSDSVTLILGDNIFYSDNFSETFRDAARRTEKSGVANLFGARVADPERFGVAEVDATEKLLNIVEKPKDPKSNIAVTGLYMYDKSVSDRAESLSPSSRGELEITDLNMTYVKEGRAQINLIDDGGIWMDAGTPDSLLEASKKICSLQNGQRFVACLEEISYRMGFINLDTFSTLVESHESSSPYGAYLRSIA